MGGQQKTDELITIWSDLVQRKPESLMSAVQNCLAIKQSYMENDEFDTGRRNLLNFGHCFGHALETVSHYRIPHGQAVVIGMLFANIVAKNMGILGSATEDYLAHKLLLSAVNAKITRSDLDAKHIAEAMKKDKKRVGKDLVIVLMTEDFIFEKITNFREEDLAPGIDELINVLQLTE